MKIPIKVNGSENPMADVRPMPSSKGFFVLSRPFLDDLIPNTNIEVSSEVNKYMRISSAQVIV